MYKCDHTNDDNLDYEEAVTREASREVWRSYHKRKEIFDLRQIQVAAGGTLLVRPAALEDSVEEPPKLDEFLAIIQDTFQSASAVYLEQLAAFKPHPREFLLKMANRFDEVAMP